MEGGAVGHLSHLYDNPELTFGEIKGILSSAADGTLERVSEKLDGLNLVISWDVNSNELKAARNSGDIKRGGMNAEELATKFFGRGNLEEAFNTSFKVLRQAISSLSDDDKILVFGENANIWYSLEIIYTENPNVINYDSNNIVFHGWPIFEINDGEISRSDDEHGINILQSNIEKMQNAVTVKNWNVRGPAMLRLKAISNGSVIKNVTQAIKKVQTLSGMRDSDTIGDYLKTMLESVVDETSYPDNVKDAIVQRCLGLPGAPSLVSIKSMLPKSQKESASQFVKSSPALLKKFIQPIEDAINDFALEALKGLQSTLINDSDAEVERLRKEVSKAIRAIEASGQDVALDVLKRQMEKLGSVDNITSAVEGVVFIYKGNAYKFTGAFAMGNQILGLFKYGRSGVKINPIEERKIRHLVKILIEDFKGVRNH